MKKVQQAGNGMEADVLSARIARTLPSFTDRKQYSEIFERLQQQVEVGVPPPVLVFYGRRGIGKTSLISYLYYRQYLAPGTSRPQHPHAWLDFSRADDVGVASNALWSVRRQLCRQMGFQVCRRFDVLWGALWEQRTQLPIRENVQLTADERKWLAPVLDHAEILLNSVNIPFIGLVTSSARLLVGALRHRGRKKVFAEVEEWFASHAKAPKGIALKTALQTIDPGRMSEWLPRALAADLAQASLTTPITVVIDGYELLRTQVDQHFGPETPTFIQLLAEELVEQHARVFIIISSNDRLRWAEAQLRSGQWVVDEMSPWAREQTRDDLEVFVSATLEQYLVGDLTEHDAMMYLTQHRDLPSVVAQSVYAITGGYPLGLSATADLIAGQGTSSDIDLPALRARLAKYERFSREWRAELDEWLVGKLLEQLNVSERRTVGSLLVVAAIPRWFNFELLQHMTHSFTLQSDFRQLVGFSIVEQPIGQSWYRIQHHPRSLLRESVRDETQAREWHASAREWFVRQVTRSQGSDRNLCLREALYHLWLLDPTAAAAELDRLYDDREMTQVEMRWQLLDTTAEVEGSLPIALRLQLQVRKAQLYALTFAQHDKPGMNKALAREAAERAVALAEESGDVAAKGRAYLALAEALNLNQQFDEAVQRAIEAGEMARKAGDQRTLALALRLRATVESANNPDLGDSRLLDEALALLPEHPEDRSDQGIVLEVLWSRAQLALRGQHYAELETILPRIEILEESPYKRAAIEQFYGEAYAQQHRWQDAKRRLERAYGLCTSLGYTLGVCAAEGWLGIALCGAGHDAEGMPKLHDALRIEHDVLDSREGVAKWLSALAELVYWPRGEKLRALELLSLAQRLQQQLEHAGLKRTNLIIEAIRDELVAETGDIAGDIALATAQTESIPSEGEFTPYTTFSSTEERLQASGDA